MLGGIGSGASNEPQHCDYRLTEVFAHEDQEILILTIDGETIDTTSEHPFFTLERGWVEAGELEIGEYIRTADWDYDLVEAREIVYQPQVINQRLLIAADSCPLGVELLEDFTNPTSKPMGAKAILGYPSGLRRVGADNKVPPGRYISDTDILAAFLNGRNIPDRDFIWMDRYIGGQAALGARPGWIPGESAFNGNTINWFRGKMSVMHGTTINGIQGGFPGATVDYFHKVGIVFGADGFVGDGTLLDLYGELAYRIAP